MDRVFILRCVTKSYEWGKLGFNSNVARLCSADKSFTMEENTPYAELWMGTHPSGPSLIPSFGNISLLDFLTQHPDFLGLNILNNFKSQGLPFLFKVLSIRKALSVQAHPDKRTAECLHQKFKDVYPDDNHKPEMAIALTEFKALCGFRQLSEIKSFISELPQLQQIIGDSMTTMFLNAENEAENMQLLKSVFTTFMVKEETLFQPLLTDLAQLFKTNTSLSNLCQSVRDVFLKLNDEYPGDIGCFCVFFLNYIMLKPGEAIFLAANEPHAYLYGDCMECMATSDNVVRAGLTPKFRDVNTLCEILTYKCNSVSKTLFVPKKDDDDPFRLIYKPPVPDFSVDKIEISSQNPYEIKEINSASILIIVEGEANVINLDHLKLINLSSGKILFISCNVNIILKPITEKILMFRAYCSANNIL